MLIFIKNARIFSENGSTASQDILIRHGKIESIGQGLTPPEGAEIWDEPGLCVSPGWMDIGAQSGDPGYEHREDLHTLARAAQMGGFTRVAIFPNTHPAIHSKSEVLYVQKKSAGELVNILPVGAISQECAGKDLAELYDMHAAGAVAFSDGEKSVQDAGLLLRALEYVKAFNGLIINEPYYKTIAAGGQMHEGVMSTSLGMKGIPALAETLMVQRDLSLLEYAGSRLHIHLISTAQSVELIRKAKNAGLNVTCSVAAANLCFTDEQLHDFDANWKVQPPLRSENDRQALLQGLRDGVIDMIVSNHNPRDIETKNLEFPYADFGMIGLETAFALCRTFAPELSLDMLIEKMAFAPRRILGLAVPEIKSGATAELTLFQPDAEWTFTTQHIGSRSHNTPLIGQNLRGKVLGVMNGEKLATV
ncbi:MAG: dihydroorotase [Saprospiraceae bacterium]|nr:dihydroorotase [Saprospiraceae bacterium]